MQLVIIISILLMLAFSSTPNATPLPEATFVDNIETGWERVERYRSTELAVTAEAFPPDGRGDHTGQIRAFFGSGRPESSLFLIHYAPGWKYTDKPPVLLIHGANQDADIAWANPNKLGSFGCGIATCPTTGLMQHLADQNFSVFAVTFAHKNGDGFIWSQIIFEAIEHITQITGAQRINIIAWSKGAFNARMYVSSVINGNRTFSNNVNKLIMLGAPNDGIDWSFRHGWNHTFAVYPECGGTINGPTAHNKMVCYGQWHDGAKEWSYGSPYFPGSVQMLKRLDRVHPLPVYEQDWYTTYYGGTGFYTSGQGIDTFVESSLVDKLQNSPPADSVSIYNLCGSSANIPLIHNEHTGPSDGVVFTASCLSEKGLGQVKASTTLKINHLQLGWHHTALNTLSQWLLSAD